MKSWQSGIIFQQTGPVRSPLLRIGEPRKKIVYSTSLSGVITANTTIARTFNPEAIQKAVSESDQDFSIGGAHLAAEAIRAGIVDEYHQDIVPIILGGKH